MLSIDDYRTFVDEALDAMAAIVAELGDERTNLRPDIEGTNTAYVILSHCLGVMEYWGGQVVAGRRIERDRESELKARGPVADLLERARQSRSRLVEDLANVEPLAPPRGPVRFEDAHLPLGRTQGGALMHPYEELAQHRGQMELTRDLVTAPWAVLVAQG